MKNNNKILAFIPARIGSKRIKEKNIIEINNKPLFQYSVDIAKASKYIDDILVSSDSKMILDLAHQQGCLNNKLRPKKLSGDKSRIIDCILYEIKHLKQQYDVIVLLQPTYPIRTVELLDNAIEEYFKHETSLVTVCECEEHPIFMRTIENNQLHKIMDESTDIRSQDLPKIYKVCGNIYINNLKIIDKNTVLNENKIPYVIDRKFCIDIDTEQDLKKAKEVLEKK